ncbi:MAG: glycosyltransferase family 4 protein [Aphanizomenon gracile PMC644.10]|jgi:glycogen(starch) synthase|nr:glycosyltransferase family 4 protein [Aphanizomenon gracile PMC644.10]
MKIALISYEYPPDTAMGGIATYVDQISRVLENRGHHVEVFSASLTREVTETISGVIVHRVLETDREHFRKKIVNTFIKRHNEVKFDVVESPEFNADAYEISQAVPEIPLAIKFHTPKFLLNKISLKNPKPNFLAKLRWYLGQMRRGIKLKAYWKYFPEDDIEYIFSKGADEFVFPTPSLADIVLPQWQISSDQISIVPYAFTPSSRLLNIPVETYSNTVTYIGRLEIRKGVICLAQAIPLVLKSCPNAKFRFVGRSQASPNPNLNMRQYLSEILHKNLSAIEFVDNVPYDDIPYYLSQTDICAFPSIWENFPNVCLEAMSAGRGIVASRYGGMKDMLDAPISGVLVEPQKPQQLANAIIKLLKNPELRIKLGENARQKVLQEYNTNRIGNLQELSYIRAIQRKIKIL